MELGKFIILRLLSFFFQFLGAIFIIFFIFNIIPYDPIGVFIWILRPESEAETQLVVQALRAQWGIDQPIYLQLFNFISDLITTGSLGSSWYGAPVNNTLGNTLPVTLVILTISMFFYVPLSVLLGIWSAKENQKGIDFSLKFITSVLYGIPYYIYAVMFLFFFSIETNSNGGIWGNIIPMLFVVLIMVIVFTSYQFRLVRAELNSVLNQNFIRTARAKGLAERTIIYKHAMQNVISEIIISLSVTIPLALSFVVVLEYIFGLPGLGPVIVGASKGVDWGMLIGISAAFLLINGFITILTDILAKVLDPLDIKEIA